MRSGRSTGVDADGADNYGVCPLRHGDVLPVSVQGELWDHTRACARARHGVLRRLRNDSQIRPIRLAAQAQGPALVRSEDPSRRDLLSKG
jgi:hypothetical protein